MVRSKHFIYNHRCKMIKKTDEIWKCIFRLMRYFKMWWFLAKARNWLHRCWLRIGHGHEIFWDFGHGLGQSHDFGHGHGLTIGHACPPRTVIKTVTNISKLSPADFISNICLQHRCSPRNGVVFKAVSSWLRIIKRASITLKSQLRFCP